MLCLIAVWIAMSTEKPHHAILPSGPRTPPVPGSPLSPLGPSNPGRPVVPWSPGLPLRPVKEAQVDLLLLADSDDLFSQFVRNSHNNNTSSNTDQESC